MAEALDAEIEQLRERAALLQKHLQVHTSTLLSAASTRDLLSDKNAAGHRDSRADKGARKRLLELCETHAAHKQQCLYRAGASITSFRVRDPDPHAVDGGRVLGLRLDVMMGAQFLRPYYILLHRDVRARPPKQRLRIHRHTVPPCVPLAGLAARYLAGAAETAGSDLYGFARALRRALVRYHNRLAVIGDLRRAVQTGRPDDDDKADQTPADVSGADPEAKQLRLDWADGRTGRLVLDDDGNIEQLVVISDAGRRDRAAAQALLAGETTASGLVRRLSGA